MARRTNSSPTAVSVVASAPVATLLTLHPTQTGTLPYLSTVFPLEREVPLGTTLVSPDDTSLASSVVATWPDGSASVVVVAGNTQVTAGTPKPLRLASALVSAAALTPAQVGQVVQSITCDFGAAGSATLSSFGTPEYTWWANAQLICCRYRLPIGSAGLEAIIDVHAFAGTHALVEVVVENGRMDTAAPVAPSDKAYANATVAVNGQVIATVNSSGCPNGGVHQPFRAWYASTWLGGDPGLTVTHDSASLQAHPLFFKVARTMTLDFNTYAPGDRFDNVTQPYPADRYRPWSVGRHRPTGMGGTGDHDSIGPYAAWESAYLCTGDAACHRASVESGLALLTYNLNYRDAATGLPPSAAQLAGKNQSNTWPNIDYGVGGTDANWESAHQPPAPLVSFLCRPSPVFLELCQKIQVWNFTIQNNGGNGRHSYTQVRARAWEDRNAGLALFLLPDAAPWDAIKASGRSALALKTQDTMAFAAKSWNTLNVVYGLYANGSPTNDWDNDVGRPGCQRALWEQYFMVIAFHAVDGARVLRGPEAQAFSEMVDWLAMMAVRYVNEAPDGRWRLHLYKTNIGDVDVPNRTIDMHSGNWGTELGREFTGTPPTDDGPFLFISTDTRSSYPWSSAGSSTVGGNTYSAQFLGALVAAKERGLPGADTAWNRVVANIPATYWDGFARSPKYNRWPRR